MIKELIQLKNYIIDDRIPIAFVGKDKESDEYEGFNFQMENKNVKYRKAKITPKKIGQFVTLWKRDDAGKTAPFDVEDDFDFYIIAVENGERSGVFVFPKVVLGERGILSNSNREGKRGFRLYAEWDLPESKQAKKTKSWQCEYFIEFWDDRLNKLRFESIFNAE